MKKTIIWLIVLIGGCVGILWGIQELNISNIEKNVAGCLFVVAVLIGVAWGLFFTNKTKGVKPK